MSSYLEDYFTKLSYTPPTSRGGRLSDEDKQDLSAELSNMDLDIQVVSAIRNIISSDRVDFGVISSVHDSFTILTHTASAADRSSSTIHHEDSD